MSSRGQKALVEQLEHELGVVAGTALGLEMLEYVGKLAETEDLNWIDLMVLRLTDEGIPLPTTIQVLAARAAYRRLHAEGTRNKTTKVWREHTKAVARANSAFLQGLDGIGAENADLRAVVSVDNELGHTPMASSLSNERPNANKENLVLGMLTSVARAFEQNSPELAAALVEHTDVLVEKAKKAKAENNPNKVGTRR